MLKFCSFRPQTLNLLKHWNRAFCLSIDPQEKRHKGYVTNSLSLNKRQYLYHTCRAVVNNEKSVEDLQNDREFGFVCSELLRDLQAHKKYPTSVKMDMLRSLLFMNLDPETKLVQYLENDIIFERKKLTADEIVDCLSFHVTYRKTDLQQKVVEHLVHECDAKFEEIVSDPKTLLNCWKFYDINTIGKKLAQKIDVATVDLLNSSSDSIDPKILMNVIVALSQTKRRNLPLLKIISQLLTKADLNGFDDPSLVISVLSALNNLNFPEATLLNSLGFCLIKCSMVDWKPNAISALLKSMGRMNWKYGAFLEKFVKYTENSPANVRTQELVSFIITSAKLNYKMSDLEQFLQNHVFPNVTLEAVADKKIWLDYVWSLAILGHLTVDLIKSVFNTSFCNELLNVDSVEQTFIKMKLLNIKAVANLEMNVIFEAPADISNIVAPVRGHELNQRVNKVINDLNSFLPCDKFMLTDVKLPIGAIINAQFVVNRDLKPIHIEKLGNPPIDMNRIPQGYKRINILVLQFKDMILGSNELIGVHNLVIRLMKKLDDVVVVVNDNWYDPNLTAINRIQSLRRLIKDNF